MISIFQYQEKTFKNVDTIEATQKASHELSNFLHVLLNDKFGNLRSPSCNQ